MHVHEVYIIYHCAKFCSDKNYLSCGFLYNCKDCVTFCFEKTFECQHACLLPLKLEIRQEPNGQLQI